MFHCVPCLSQFYCVNPIFLPQILTPRLEYLPLFLFLDRFALETATVMANVLCKENWQEEKSDDPKCVSHISGLLYVCPCVR